MSDYQKVEFRSEETGAMSPENVESLEQEAAAQGEVEQSYEERPEWLDQKFESPEAMAFAYKQLESEFTKLRQGEETEQPENTGDLEQLSDADFAPFAEEFNETGDVSEISRQKIEEWGIPRAYIDAYIEGQKAVSEGQVQSVFNAVGGEANYNTMLAWAQANLPEQEIDTFNEMVMGNDQQMNMAVQGLWARFNQGGNQPMLQGDTGSSAPTGAFQSRAQVTAAMSDPRYRNDPAYREEVYRKLQQSNVI